MAGSSSSRNIAAEQQHEDINEVDGPCKRITLKIDKLSEFKLGDTNGRRLSEPIFIRGFPWKILAFPREMGRRFTATKCLGYFLQCNADDKDSTWSCTCSATLRVVAQKEGKVDHTRDITHTFNAEENDWGFAQFMTFETLMDPENGWYDEADDSLLLAVDVKDSKIQVRWDSKKSTGLKLLTSLEEMFESGKHTDFMVGCRSDNGEKRGIPAHKIVLASRSPVFAAMLESHTEEAQKGEVHFNDIDHEVMRQILSYIYTGRAPMVNQMAQELFIAADRFQLDDLKKIAGQVLRADLSVDNVCRNLVLADRYNAQQLKNVMLRFIVQHSADIINTEDWSKLLKEYPKLATEAFGAMSDELVRMRNLNAGSTNGQGSSAKRARRNAD